MSSDSEVCSNMDNFFRGTYSRWNARNGIIAASDEANAARIANEDPVVRSGYYRSLTVQEVSAPYPKR